MVASGVPLWKERLDRQDVALKGYWTHTMSVSEGSVTITNTYTGKRSTSWPKNGMSNSGTATWTPPSKTNGKGKDVLGAGSPRGNRTKEPEAMTVSRKFGAGTAEGDRMAICVTAAGETEMVQTEFLYEWKRI